MQNPVWFPLEHYAQGVEVDFVPVYIHSILEIKYFCQGVAEILIAIYYCISMITMAEIIQNQILFQIIL